MPKRQSMNASSRTVNDVLDLTRQIFPTDPGQADVVSCYILAIVEREVGIVLKKQNETFGEVLRQNEVAYGRLVDEAVTRAYAQAKAEFLAGSPGTN